MVNEEMSQEQACRIIDNCIKPVNRRVLVVRDVQGAKTKEGLQLPEQSRKHYSCGVVAAACPSVVEKISVGDRVSFLSWAGMNQELVTDDGEVVQFVMLTDEDVTMVLEGGGLVSDGKKVGQ